VFYSLLTCSCHVLIRTATKKFNLVKTDLHWLMPKRKKQPNGPGKGRANVSTTVDLEISAEIDRLAATGGITRSQWAREALTEAAQEASVYSITKNTEVTKSSGNLPPLEPWQRSVGGSSTANRPSSRQVG
jgi:hypothetical protein